MKAIISFIQWVFVFFGDSQRWEVGVGRYVCFSTIGGETDSPLHSDAGDETDACCWTIGGETNSPLYSDVGDETIECCWDSVDEIDGRDRDTNGEKDDSCNKPIKCLKYNLRWQSNYVMYIILGANRGGGFFRG